MSDTEVFTPTNIYCPVGEMYTSVMIPNGILKDNTVGFVEGVCPGCQRLGVNQIRQDVENSVEGRLKINFVDLHRFNREKPHKIIVFMCSALNLTPKPSFHP